MSWTFALAAALAALPAAAATPPSSPPAWDAVPLAQGHEKPDLVLTGHVDRRDYQHNLTVPFAVPEGVERIAVELTYTKGDGRTVINMGLNDGHHIRGWSGSNKHVAIIDAVSATPAYHPGTIGAGKWSLDLGVSFIGEGVVSDYTARIWFWRKGERPAVSTYSAAPLRSEARWYRGDLHLHTGDSDGFCTSRRGQQVPCPLYRTVDAAEKAQLDFIAITDHNGAAHFNEMRRLQPYYDDVLLIPGRELTTAQGHANLFGASGELEYRLGSPPGARDMMELFREAKQAGALVSLNHAASQSSSGCRGCGWSAPDAATAMADAMEAVNGGGLLHSGGMNDAADTARWEEELAKGRHTTAIGGSDAHDVDMGRLGVGYPATVVFAPELSERAILAGIAAGHVWVDLTGHPGGFVDLQAVSGAWRGMMGDTAPLPKGAVLALNLTTKGFAGASLAAIVDGKADQALSRAALGDGMSALSYVADGQRHWLRFEIRRGEAVLAMTNPVYIEPAR
ncbi:MAG TPA: CehA/McbA family metallohydrolase [Novosphingobium sp.]|nr:CehA/McbA family metallohydrolase [Novosphingobium sp.]